MAPEAASGKLYHDKFVDIYSDHLCIKSYYFPFGKEKRIEIPFNNNGELSFTTDRDLGFTLLDWKAWGSSVNKATRRLNGSRPTLRLSMPDHELLYKPQIVLPILTHLHRILLPLVVQPSNTKRLQVKLLDCDHVSTVSILFLFIFMFKILIVASLVSALCKDSTAQKFCPFQIPTLELLL